MNDNRLYASTRQFLRPKRCSLVGDFLEFTWDAKPKYYNTRRNLWARFIELAGEDNEHIRRFAEKYGPLGIRPYSQSDSLDDWRQYANLGRHLVRARRQLLEGRVGKQAEETDWKVLDDWAFDHKILPVAQESTRGIQTRMLLLALSLNKWLDTPGLCGFSCSWRTDKFEVQPDSRSLLGTVGLQLADVLRFSKTSCAGCGREFHHSRQATIGKRCYCPTCREKGIPVRDAMRDYRNRKKLQKALSS